LCTGWGGGRAAPIRAFEFTFEPLGLTALAIQVVTGLWMGWIYLSGFQGIFNPARWHWPGTSAASPPWRSLLWRSAR